MKPSAIMSRYLTIIITSLILIVGPSADLHAVKPWAPFRFSYMKRIVRKIKRLAEPPQLEDLAFKQGTTVIGVEPSWLLKDGDFGKYYYRMLTDVVVGEYDINLYDGSPRNPSAPDEEFELVKQDRYDDPYLMLQLARYENMQIRALLQVNLLDEQHDKEQDVSKTMKDFLANVDLHEEVKTRVDSVFLRWEEQYNIPYQDIGILLDYEILFGQESPILKEDFIRLVRALKFKKGQDEETQQARLLYLRLPDLNKEADMHLDSNSLAEIKKYVDLFLVKDYGYERFSDGHFCPCLSLNAKEEYSLPALINYYTEKLGISKDSLIVESSFHANRMPDEIGDPMLHQVHPYARMDDSLRNAKIKSKYLRDSTSCAYFESRSKARFYYSDSLTYAKKLNWIHQQNLAGVSLWGLGYIGETMLSDKKKDIWPALAANYAELPVQSGWLAASITFFLLTLSLLYSVIMYWDVRNILDKHRPYLIKLSWIPILFSTITLVCLDIIPRQLAIYVLVTIVMGFFVVYIIIRRGIMRVRRYLRYIGIRI